MPALPGAQNQLGIRVLMRLKIGVDESFSQFVSIIHASVKHQAKSILADANQQRLPLIYCFGSCPHLRVADCRRAVYPTTSAIEGTMCDGVEHSKQERGLRRLAVEIMNNRDS